MASDEELHCAVKGCENPAIARVLPTHGTTEHDALRCRDCLVYDLNREWFEGWRRSIERDEEHPVMTDGGRFQDDIPLLHDNFERCDECGEIVLMHGRGECLELDDAVYCPRHARAHMDDEEWELRWGEAMRLLEAIRTDRRKALKYALVGCPGHFWVTHDEGQHYKVWRRCEEGERNYTGYSESSLVRNLERRYSVGAYVGDPPHLVEAARAPINADVPLDEGVIKLAY